MQASSFPSFQNILFVFALEKEASPLIKLLSIPQDLSLLENPVISAYSGFIKNLKVTIIYPKTDPKFNCDSIGPENSAVAAYVGIQTYRPDLIVSAGSAGAFQKGEEKVIAFDLGDVCYSKNPVGFIDREIVLDEFKDYMVGKYDIIELSNIFKELGFKEAAIGTTSSFHDFSAEFSIRKGVDLQEMESAAIQKIAFLMKVPFVTIKIVVSLNFKVDDPDQISKRYFEHVEEKSEILAGKLKMMLEKFII